MLCFGAASINVEQPTPARPKQQVSAQGPPAWLHSFVDSEDYLSNCPMDCFSANMSQELGEKAPRSHRRRYFCTECPQEGAICLGKIIEHHLKHRVLKVRKVNDVGGPMIKVRDIEPLLDISYVVQQSNPNDDIPYVKLKTYRQSMWGAASAQVLCYECLRLANSDESYKYKYCSIKCAHPNTVNIVPTPTVQDLAQAKGYMRSKSCRETILRHRRESKIPAPFGFPAPGNSALASASPSTSDSLSSPSKGWLLGRFSKYLAFGRSKKHISPSDAPIKKPIPRSENTSLLTISSQERKSSWENFETFPVNEAEPGGSNDCTTDHTQTSRHPPPQTLGEKRQPQDNEKVRVRSSKLLSKDGGTWASLLDPDDSLSAKSTATTTPFSCRVNGLNVKAGPVTTLYWRTEQGYGSDEEVVQEKWGVVRNRILDSAGMAYATYRFENESEQTSREPVEVFVSGFDPTARYARAPQEWVVYSGSHENTPARGYAPQIHSKRQIPANARLLHEGNFLTRRNALYEMRQGWKAWGT